MIMRAHREPLRTLSVRLPESLYQRVKSAAHGKTVDEAMSIADFIREALEHDLSQKETHAATPDSRRDLQAARARSWLSGTAEK